MNIRQLKSILQQYPDDMPVMVIKTEAQNMNCFGELNVITLDKFYQDELGNAWKSDVAETEKEKLFDALVIYRD